MGRPYNGIVYCNSFNCNYTKFGNGEKNLILIPGVGDGLKTVKGLANYFSITYRKFKKDYTVYSFSRRNNIPKDFTIEEMADDLAKCMEELNIEKADIVGVSQGGMIGQSLAINYKDKINKLVLVVTTPKLTEELKESIFEWIGMAYKEDYEGIMIDTAKRSYREKYLKKYDRLYRFLSKFTKPKSFDRFITIARACINFDVYKDLNKIECPTLIIGGSIDKVLGVEGSILLNKNIKNSELYIYEGYSHGLYDEAKDFKDRLLEYLKK